MKLIEMKVAEVSFLCRLAGLTNRDRVRSSGAAPLHQKEPAEAVRASDPDASWTSFLEVFQARPTGRRPQGRPRPRWRDYMSRQAGEWLGIPQEEQDGGKQWIKIRAVLGTYRCLI